MSEREQMKLEWEREGEGGRRRREGEGEGQRVRCGGRQRPQRETDHQENARQDLLASREGRQGRSTRRIGV